MTSPPTFSCLAFLSVITPFEVEIIATPTPFSTLGSSSEPLYCLKPGLEALWMLLIAGLLVCLSYYKAILIFT